MASAVELDALVACLLTQGIGSYNARIVRDKLADITPKSSDEVRDALTDALELPTIDKVCRLIEDGIPVPKSETKSVKSSEVKALRKQLSEQSKRLDAAESSIRALDAVVAKHDEWVNAENEPVATDSK